MKVLRRLCSLITHGNKWCILYGINKIYIINLQFIIRNVGFITWSVVTIHGTTQYINSWQFSLRNIYLIKVAVYFFFNDIHFFNGTII